MSIPKNLIQSYWIEHFLSLIYSLFSSINTFSIKLPSVPVVLADQVIHLPRLVLPVRASPSIRWDLGLLCRPVIYILNICSFTIFGAYYLLLIISCYCIQLKILSTYRLILRCYAMNTGTSFVLFLAAKQWIFVCQINTQMSYKPGSGQSKHRQLNKMINQGFVESSGNYKIV